MKQSATLQTRRLALTLGAVLLTRLLTLQSWASPVSVVLLYNDAPFKGAWVSTPLTSSDGLLTVAVWKDTNATVPANLYQWWYGLGVDSGTGNGALIDGQESMTLQFDKSVACDRIFFNYGGDQIATSVPQQIAISGFLSDPGAYANVGQAPYISNLSYANGTLTFDYLWDTGWGIGRLFFANPAACAGRTLKINYNGTDHLGSSGVMVSQVASQEAYGGPQLQPVNVRYNAINVYTTADGALTVRGYSDQAALTPANFGTSQDECFGVYGGNNGSINGSESLTLQFASGFGLSRFEVVYSSGQVSISGFASDPGFTDLANGSYGASYADGVLSFYVMDGGHHTYFFNNRAASAGRTLRVTVEPSSELAIAGIGYVSQQTLLSTDVLSFNPTYATPDGLLTLNPYADTPGTTPAYLYENNDWLGVGGGNNSEAIEGTESLELQFSGGAGLAGLGSRYTGGTIIISGFASDPGFSDPSGVATGVSYANGTLTYTFDAWRAHELVVNFSNPAASAGRTLSLHTDAGANSQIALTRINYAVAPVKLSITKVGSNVVLSWPMGTLQRASSVTGAYNDVTGAASPYTNAISGTQNFFRVKVP